MKSKVIKEKYLWHKSEGYNNYLGLRKQEPKRKEKWIDEREIIYTSFCLGVMHIDGSSPTFFFEWFKFVQFLVCQSNVNQKEKKRTKSEIAPKAKTLNRRHPNDHWAHENVCNFMSNRGFLANATIWRIFLSVRLVRIKNKW